PEDKMPKVTTPENFTPANYNQPEMVANVKTSAAKYVGETNILYAEPQMVAEDYAMYGLTEHKVPSVMYWLGSVPKERIESGMDLPGLHSPFYYPDPSLSIETGVNVNVQIMLDLLQ
ncbi:MAG: amidohydrolase, partial [Bacteroidota bacterium]